MDTLPKVKKCSQCDNKFTAECQFELDDYGELINDSIYYSKRCEPCIMKIDHELLRLVQCYQMGLRTANELVDDLQLYNKEPKIKT